MKKGNLLLVILALFTVVLVTGCSETKTLTCTGTIKGDGVNAQVNTKYTFKKDKISSAKTEIVYKDFGVSDVSSVWSTFKETFKEKFSEINEKGLKRTVKFDDEKYTATLTLEVDFETVEKDVYLAYASEDYSQKTYDELKKELSNQEGISCK